MDANDDQRPPPYSVALLSPTQPQQPHQPHQDHDQELEQHLHQRQQQRATRTATGHIILACIVFCTGNLLFGLVAFVLAVLARNKAHSDVTQSKRLGRASLGVSVTGILLTFVVVVDEVFSNVVPSSSSSGDACPFSHDSSCYRLRNNVGRYGYCDGTKSGFYCFTNDSVPCPYHAYDGRCYEYKSNVGKTGNCIGVKSAADGTCFHDGSCKYFGGSCYAYETNVGTYGYCAGVKSGFHCYSDADSTSPCPYFVFDGRCYQYRSDVTTGLCIGVKSAESVHCYHDGRCKFLDGSCYMYQTPANNYSHCWGPKSNRSCYSNDECSYFVDAGGTCYRFRANVSSSGICIGVKTSDYCYHDGSCRYVYDGSCYKYEGSIHDYAYCSGARSGSTCYSSSDSSSCPYHVYEAQCYRYKNYVGLFGDCFGVKPFLGNVCYHNGSCMYVKTSCYRYKTNATAYSECVGIKETGFCFTDLRNCPGSTTYYLGACYQYKIHIYNSNDCTGVKFGAYCYTNEEGYLYHYRHHHHYHSGSCEFKRQNHIFVLGIIYAVSIVKFR